jgi:hypothetical protein
MLVKEIIEEKWKPKFYFFTAGNFLSDIHIVDQFILKWVLFVVVIDMDELFRQGNQDDIMNYLN